MNKEQEIKELKQKIARLHLEYHTGNRLGECFFCFCMGMILIIILFFIII